MTVDNDLIVPGTLYAKNMTAPPSSVTDSSVAAGANIATSKLRHKYHPSYGQANTAALSETRPLYVVRGATALVVKFCVGSIAAAAGNATVTVDLQKNGATVLTGVVTLNSSSVARLIQSASILTTAAVVGDWFDVVITATIGSGTLPTGVFCELEIDEDAN